MTWTLIEHHEPLAVVRLPAGSRLPAWADALPLTSVAWTHSDTTVICPSRCVPTELPGVIEGPFTAFEVQGPLDLGLSGVLAQLTVPLAEAQVGVLSVSTFATDWLLVKSQFTQAARAGWLRAGHTIVQQKLAS